MEGMNVLGVIPARFASTRLPGKPLADIHGKPMIQWVYERAKQARGLTQVIIATDDERVLRAAQNFGAQAVMTSSDLISGTDRVAAVADLYFADAYLNIQGDEPLIESESIDAAVELLHSNGRFAIGTLMTQITSAIELSTPSIVKVIVDREGRAIYFSRFPIPYSREQAPENLIAGDFICKRHIGLYAYTREALLRFRSLKPSDLEKAESLEQLRALHDGMSIGVAEVKSASIGVDTPEDLDRVRKLLS